MEQLLHQISQITAERQIRKVDHYDAVSRNEQADRSYIPNRYMLVNVVARRARQIAEEAEATGEHLDEKPVTLAIHEVAEGKFDAHTMDT